MSYESIREALETRLNTMTGVPAIAWENVEYEPTLGTKYIKASIANLAARAAAIGNASQDRYEGAMFIDICIPKDQGPLQADQLADLIKVRFPKGLKLTADSKDVWIKHTEIYNPASSNPDWYVLPMMITWYSYI